MTARLAPEIVRHLAACAEQGALNLARLEPEAARAASALGQELGTQRVEWAVDAEDFVLELPGRKLDARLYRPRGAAGTLPVLVWYHGGGFVMCDLDSADQICSRFAVHTGAAVVSIGYRLAPEHPWPAAHLDAVDSVDWLVRHAADLGLDAGRIAVAGDSAGATLAAAAAAASGSRGLGIVAQVLLYPVVSAAMSSRSYADFATGYGLERDEMIWFLRHYGVLSGPGAAAFDAVLANPDSGTPPMFLVSCECDVLRDEGEGYAARAAAAGVEVIAARYLGMPHGFVQMTSVTPQAGAALAAATQFLRRIFGHRGTEPGPARTEDPVTCGTEAAR